MMNREKVWHAVRAAADILETRRLVIVGSTVVLLTHRNYSARLALSREVDLFPEDPALHAEMDYALEEIGLQSAFDVTHGFYVDGVEPALIKMPADWQTRARTLTSDLAPGVEVILPDLNDIALAKLVAWREKDIDWLEEALRTGLLDHAAMAGRIDRIECELPIGELQQRLATLPGSGRQRSSGSNGAGPDMA